MNAAEHYARAEELIDLAERVDRVGQLLAAAQVHATLALVAVTRPPPPLPRPRSRGADE